tara:strand:+ start:988 stop:1680 length:693 start_codon:yes stop_codon:yes gene_type:complete
MRITNKRKKIIEEFNFSKNYNLKSACEIVKKSSTENFDASVDLAIRLGVDPKQANQMVRGVASLPHGTGKKVSVLAIVTEDKKEEAQNAGADHVGFEEYIDKIKKGWTDVDVIVTMPSAMSKIGALGKVLGPRGLMPNPKSGTVTNEIGKAIEEIKKGKIDFKVDKNGIVHAAIGKVSFQSKSIEENAEELISTIKKLKPAASKGTYIKSINISSTMGHTVSVDSSTFNL